LRRTFSDKSLEKFSSAQWKNILQGFEKKSLFKALKMLRNSDLKDYYNSLIAP
jgi:hypothetical protein